MKITVTQKDIDEGKPRQACNCPIYLAVKRMGMDNSVACGHISIYKETHTIRAMLPNKAAEFVSRFDTGKSVEPFEFEIFPK